MLLRMAHTCMCLLCRCTYVLHMHMCVVHINVQVYILYHVTKLKVHSPFNLNPGLNLVNIFIPEQTDMRHLPPHKTQGTSPVDHQQSHTTSHSPVPSTPRQYLLPQTPGLPLSLTGKNGQHDTQKPQGHLLLQENGTVIGG